MYAAALEALGAFACGLSLSELNTPSGVMREALGIPMVLPGPGGEPAHVLLNGALWGLALASLSCGGLVGTRTILAFADASGRRPAFVRCAALHVAGGALQSVAGLWLLRGGEGGGDSPRVGTPAYYGDDPSDVGGAGGEGGLRLGGGLASRTAFASHDSGEGLPSPLLLPLALLLLGRFASGCACGSYTLLLPVYFGELSPIQLRGALFRPWRWRRRRARRSFRLSALARCSVPPTGGPCCHCSWRRALSSS